MMISISPANHLTVTVPKNFSDSLIQEFLARQSRWIEKKIQRNLVFHEHYPPKTYQPGDHFFYLGARYHLELLESETRSIKVEGASLCVAASRIDLEGRDGESVASMICAWYEGMAYQILKERTAVFEKRMNIKANRIQVRMLEGQWGSCAVSGNLSYNARLVMAPLEIVDYVVVHELSHRVHHNHSARFWKLVELWIPDYRQRRKWLREHGQFLTL